jgi:hypothetical protein
VAEQGPDTLAREILAVAERERVVLLDTAMESGILEMRDDGYLYLPAGHSPSALYGLTGWERWWKPWGDWSQAGREIRREFKQNGKVRAPS